MRKKIGLILRKAMGGDAEVSIPENEKFGHYSTNVAMKLARGKKAAPRQRGEPCPAGRGNSLELAAELAAKIEKSAPAGFFEKVEVAAPGFINLWVSKKILRDELVSIFRQKERYGRSDVGRKKKVIVEYSSVNVAKPMHVGHLRSTVIGDALANVLEFAGYKVIRWNYVGDWGTQFGKLIAAYKRWGRKSEVEKSPIGELLSLYVRFHKKEVENPIFLKEGQEEFMKLEAGDKENRKLWRWFSKESMEEFKKVYGILGVKFDVVLGESFFEPFLKPLVERLYKKKIATESEGALVVNFDKFSAKKGLPPALVQKSDESSLYLTRDIANLEYRIKKYKPSGIIYVVGNEQALHFEQLFAIAGIIRLKNTKLAHVKYGLVLGEKGKKLSTRGGEAIQLEELLRKSVGLAGKIVEQKNPKLKAREKNAIAEAVGVGAVKYNDLKENRMSDIYFDWDKMLDFSGDSAPYIQYTHARLRSILRKAHKASGIQYPSFAKASVGKQVSSLDTDIEMALIRKIAEFPETVRRSAENFFTNNIARYLYELANLANKYYESTPILTDKNVDRRNVRLMLINSVAVVIKNGLGLLGIKAPEKI
ncbi:MAG: arginine--tRNA ligase [Candidatus Liptonbacteria bacterium]|nr:arginine--tRNA ligase [Candidatus Liptonbacteria bacterium]